jgi:hypothetical protein
MHVCIYTYRYLIEPTERLSNGRPLGATDGELDFTKLRHTVCSSHLDSISPLMIISKVIRNEEILGNYMHKNIIHYWHIIILFVFNSRIGMFMTTLSYSYYLKDFMSKLNYK